MDQYLIPKDTRSAVTVSRNLIAPHGLRAIYQEKPRHHGATVTHRSASLPGDNLKEVTDPVDSVWATIIYYIPLPEGLPLPGGLVDLSPRHRTFAAETSPTA